MIPQGEKAGQRPEFSANAGDQLASGLIHLACIAHRRPDRGHNPLPEQRNRDLGEEHRETRAHRQLVAEVPAATAIARSGLQARARFRLASAVEQTKCVGRCDTRLANH
jgi:hypothetical protein